MASTQVTVWHGKQQQFNALRSAIEHNCTCEKATIVNSRPATCPAHQILTDQATLDHLAFVGTRAQQYWFNEFLT